jgi:hypothetical protein
MVGEVLMQCRSCPAVVDVDVLAGVASALGLMRAVVSEARISCVQHGFMCHGYMHITWSTSIPRDVLAWSRWQLTRDEVNLLLDA